MASPGDGFDDWYRGAHGRLAAALLAFTGSTELAADAVDEACMRALAHWSRVGVMAGPDAWVYRTAINHAKRRLRRAALERRLLSRLGEAQVLPGPAGELWQVVGDLPLRQRTAVVLRYVADLPEAEVAEIMGVGRGTVASTLSEARHRLRERLGEDVEKLAND
ncbi:MAG TPA: sigma factor-like helix-turn-helix DNA-binding protein [Acidimicrobiales bacterium]|nr:sigma factor-like helix-turn-helix DNA-binding protein [Acidimicrobiales bacterium]